MLIYGIRRDVGRLLVFLVANLDGAIVILGEIPAEAVVRGGETARGIDDGARCGGRSVGVVVVGFADLIIDGRVEAISKRGARHQEIFLVESGVGRVGLLRHIALEGFAGWCEDLFVEEG